MGFPRRLFSAVRLACEAITNGAPCPALQYSTSPLVTFSITSTSRTAISSPVNAHISQMIQRRVRLPVEKAERLMR